MWSNLKFNHHKIDLLAAMTIMKFGSVYEGEQDDAEYN